MRAERADRSVPPMRRTLLAALTALLLAPASAGALPARGTIGFGGMAGVAPEMPRAEAESRWGRPDSCNENSASTVCSWKVGRSTARIVFDANARVERAIVEGPARGRIGKLGAYRTAEGIGLGTGVDRMLHAYPRDPFGAVNGGLVALIRRNPAQTVFMAFSASPSRKGRVSRISVGSNDPIGASRTFKPAAADAMAAAGPLRMSLQYDVGVTVVQPNPDCSTPTTAISTLEANFRSPRSRGYRVAAGLVRGQRRAADVRNRLDRVSFGAFERVGRIGVGVGIAGDVRMRASGLCADHGGELDMSDCRNHPRRLVFRPLESFVRGTGRRYAYVTTSLLQSSEGGFENAFAEGCGDVLMRLVVRPLSFVVPARPLLSGAGTLRIPAVGNGTEVVIDDDSGRRTTTTQQAFLIVTRGRAGAAQSSLPACEPAKNGFLDGPRVDDPEQRQGSRALYATHRLQVRAFPDIDVPDDPDGTQYETLGESVRLAPVPGVVGPLAFVGDAPGPTGLPVLWTVTRGLFGEPEEPYCTGSETIPVTLRKPSPTSVGAARLLVDRTGAWPRVQLAIAGRPSDDLRPVSVRIRRGASGRPRTLFALPLANVSSDTARYRFTRRFAGMTVRSGPRDASMSNRGLVVVDVSVPKLRDDRRLRRDFTLEVVREGRTLLRVRAVLACRGIGSLEPAQLCTTPLWRVTRPRR